MFRQLQGKLWVRRKDFRREESGEKREQLLQTEIKVFAPSLNPAKSRNQEAKPGSLVSI